MALEKVKLSGRGAKCSPQYIRIKGWVDFTKIEVCVLCKKPGFEYRVIMDEASHYCIHQEELIDPPVIFPIW